jgi:hypothetical protein
LAKLNQLAKKEITMTFTYKNSRGNVYYLHSRETQLKNGQKSTIYFFAKEEKAGKLDAVPAGYKVAETANGLPVLKKNK